MKRILLLVVFLCIAGATFAQKGWTRPNTLFGTRQKRIAIDSTFFFPTGCGTPVGEPGLQAYDIGSGTAANLKQSALFFDSCAGVLWVFHPKPNIWLSLSLPGGGENFVDSVYYRSNEFVDSFFYTKNGAEYLWYINIAVNGVIQGLKVTQNVTPYHYSIAPSGDYKIGSTKYFSEGDDDVEIPPKCAVDSQSRFIRFWANTAGGVGITVGDCAAFPIMPALADTQVELSFILQTSRDSFPAVTTRTAWWTNLNDSITDRPISSANAIGTIDNKDVIFKRGSGFAGILNPYLTAFGVGALNAWTTLATDTRYATAIGAGALGSMTTGQYNTAVGQATLPSVVTGSGNTALGYDAGRNTTGSNNTYIGYNIWGNGSASGRVFIGSSAGGGGNSNSLGTESVSIGYNSGVNNQQTYCTYIGTNAGTYHSVLSGSAGSGTANTGIGYSAMLYKRNGDGNTAVGYLALQGQSAVYDTVQAPYTGNNNTAVGRESMMEQGGGNNNVAIGYQSRLIDTSRTTGSNQVSVGNSLYKSTTSSWVLGGTAYDASAELKIISPGNNKGFMIPSMTSVQRLAMVSPANGNMVYDTDSSCVMLRRNAAWESLCRVTAPSTGQRFGVSGEDEVGAQDRYFAGGNHYFIEHYSTATDSLVIDKSPTGLAITAENAAEDVTLIQQGADALYLIKTNQSTGQKSGIYIADTGINLVADDTLKITGTSGANGFRYHRYTSTLTGFNLLAIDTTSGGVFKYTGSLPSGTVTSVATNTGSGITGGTITGSGTLAIDTTIISTRAWRNKLADSLGAIIATKGTGTVTSVGTGLGLTGGAVTTTGTVSLDTSSSVVLSRQRAANTYQTSLSGTGLLSFSGTTPSYNTTSSSIAGIISDETGSGALAFATSPSFTTPSIGAATGTSINLQSNAAVIDPTVSTDYVFKINRTINSGAASRHGYGDATTFSVGTNLGYASYDDQFTNTVPMDHHSSFQARPVYAGSSTMALAYGLIHTPTVSSGATVTDMYDVKINAGSISGSVTNRYGIWIDALTAGTSAIGINDLAAKNMFTGTPTATANYGVANFGHGAFDGATSGFAVGNSNGNIVMINSTAAYTGNQLLVQKGGVTGLSVSGVNVGIGITSPSANLQVHTPATSTLSAVQVSNNSTGSNVSSGLWLQVTSGNLSELNNKNATSLTLKTNNTSALTISASQASTFAGTVTLRTGTATANTSPIKFVSGTNLTTPEDGALEYNGTDLQLDVSTTRYVLNKALTGSATLDFGSTGAGAVADLTITVTGAADGDPVILGAPNGAITATATYTAWVSAANTVTVRFSPKATEDPASGTFKVRVIK